MLTNRRSQIQPLKSWSFVCRSTTTSWWHSLLCLSILFSNTFLAQAQVLPPIFWNPSPPSTSPTPLPRARNTPSPTTRIVLIPPSNPPVTMFPTASPTLPVVAATAMPTSRPTAPPTTRPTTPPTTVPTAFPSGMPVVSTNAPTTRNPTPLPTPFPTIVPSSGPTGRPSPQPAVGSSVSPSQTPSQRPSLRASAAPSTLPSRLPTTEAPTVTGFTQFPTALSSATPSEAPVVPPTPRVPTNNNMPTIPVTRPTVAASPEETSNTALFIGASAAAGALVALAVLACFVVMRKKKASSHKLAATPTRTASPSSSQQPYNSNYQATTEILVRSYQEGGDEVSTLGDPLAGQYGMHSTAMQHDQERTASIGEEYEYTKQYMLGQHGQQQQQQQYRPRVASQDSAPSTTEASGIRTKVSSMVFSDESSFEEQFASQQTERFDVMAPAGKLGMVIDTPDGGLPVVHAIKPTSVLAPSVQVGDLLVGVDQDDVSNMTAIQISRMISQRGNQRRVLTFVRAGKSG